MRTRERDRITADLHELGQDLTSIALLTKNMEIRLERTAPDLLPSFEDLSESVQRAIRTMRGIVEGLDDESAASGSDIGED